MFGGLGNQLFQFFAGAEVSQTRETNLQLDFSWNDLSLNHNNSDIREFDFAQPSQWIEHRTNILHPPVFRIPTALGRKFAEDKNFFGINTSLYEINSKCLQNEITLRLFGYYQTYIYYKSYTERNPNFSPRLTNPSSHFEYYSSYIEDLRPLIIHIRGGDYLHNPGIYLNLPADYYERAITEISSLQNSKKILVFTDDENYVKEKYPQFSASIFKPDCELTAAEAILLMGKGTGLIIANSSFSYWGAIFAPKTIPVIAPDRWLQGRMLPATTYPYSWIRI